MNTFPQIITKRLRISQLEIQDIPEIIKYAGNKNVSDLTINIPFPYKNEDAAKWIENSNNIFKNAQGFTFKISLRGSNIFIGSISLNIVPHAIGEAELGFWIAENYWNQGYATEATKAVIEFGFDNLNITKIYASHFSENVSSGKVLVKNNMSIESKFEIYFNKKEKFVTSIKYQILKEDFLNTRI